ncbi:hypothetical protein NC651_007878 [Populus alba x Populus x berolinensis]|nr:hypothetical protein NC651_007878 [Populus alba x Populus x berolinensis]
MESNSQNTIPTGSAAAPDGPSTLSRLFSGTFLKTLETTILQRLMPTITGIFVLSSSADDTKGRTLCEKEHEKYTKTEMHESFSTSGSRPSDHCGFKTDARSSPSLFDSSD